MLKCRICSGEKFTTILSNCKSNFSLKKCDKCLFVSTDPLLTEQELRQYYDQNYWQKSKGIEEKLLDLLYNFRMFGLVRDIKKIIPQKGRILDWGAGDGSLMRLLKKKGIECWGIDRYSIKPEEKNILNKTIEQVNFPDESFDVITCFHVLEHLENPVKGIKKASQILKPGGLMIIEVPNIDSWGFKIFRKKWYPLDIPFHLNHFDSATLTRILKDNNQLEIVKISYFSHRASPASFVVSCFPDMDPRIIRKKHQGKLPFSYKIVYLLLQLIAYIPVSLEILFSKGETIRIYAKKPNRKL